ncbi:MULTISPECIES: ThiF family adenylyltransferase [unclassified Streptomyces]|uniref:ThiF family adenylyltransferase n=1 Tax=unclassified Streptomyces TaxID=2593676 RepID=UPI000DB9BEB5|nr:MULTISPECIES: ThiF family adenylyltransferase [unclassified Streptomyces]MYT75929.1 ThiF family adenylyltransferase [Streptomyces sp. SID8367]RAJ77759.1 bacteriocin biosynthesis cyclodehydratase domain-containing protein [Streptomyces sp. PsTaAH-137]
MHPILKPALRRGWHDLNTVQFGVSPAHAVVLGPVDTATGSFLTLLDGTRGVPLLREEARRMGLPDGHVDALLERLTGAGLLDDATGGGPDAEALRRRTGVMDRLRPDHAALTVTTSDPADGMRKLAARHAVRVQVRGAGRVGAVVASVLAAAGVGHVDVRDGGCVEPWDVAPGGQPAEAVGERREVSAQRVVRATAPARPPRPDRRRTAPRPAERDQGEPPLSLVIVAPRDGLGVHSPDPVAVEDLMAAGIPHLYAGVVEATGVVGPLVLPGGTGCARCLLLGRVDRDPTWPRLLAQWGSGRSSRQVQACDVGLSTAVAGLAAAHGLAFLDGELPSSTGARWEASAPGLDWHARPVWPHPECPCGAGEGGYGKETPVEEEPHDTMAG